MLPGGPTKEKPLSDASYALDKGLAKARGVCSDSISGWLCHRHVEEWTIGVGRWKLLPFILLDHVSSDSPGLSMRSAQEQQFVQSGTGAR
jgi:hypothetical protein